MYRFFKKNREAVKRYLLIFFLGVVSIGMVITLAPISGGDTTQISKNVLARIDGADITSDDLRRTLSSRLQNSGLAQHPEIVPRIAGSLLDQMIFERALMAQARSMGLVVTDDELTQSLQSMPGLYQDGKFAGMAAYQSMVQERTGMSVGQFEAQMKQRLLIDKVRDAVTDNVVVTPAQVHDEFNRRNEKTKVNYAVFEPSHYLKTVEATPAALEAFFKKDPSHYQVPPQRRVRYALIDADRVRSQAVVDDSALRQYYNMHLSDFRVPDRVKVAHILFKTIGKNPAEIAEIQKKAQGALDQVKGGGDFADLARKNSEDTGSAQSGGEIGWIIHGQTVKEFDQSAFSMHPGELRLVKTEYGFHIIRLEEKQVAHLETFDEAKAQLRTELEKQKLSDVQQAVADRFYRQARANPTQFDILAKKAGLEVRESPPFKQGEVVPDFGNSESFANLAFQLRQGDVGEPISVPKGLAVIQVAEIVPEHVPSLNEVQARVEEDYRASQSNVVADQKAQQFLAKLKGGEDFKKTAKEFDVTVQESKDITRQDNLNETIPGSTMASAFGLSIGQSGLAKAANSTVVFQVVAHTPANELDFAAQQSQIAEDLLRSKRDVAFEIYEQNLKQQMEKSGKLTLNAANMKSFLATYQGRSY